jgi:hypothetical protein
MCVMRNEVDPQNFQIEYITGETRTYTSTERYIIYLSIIFNAVPVTETSSSPPSLMELEQRVTTMYLLPVDDTIDKCVLSPIACCLTRRANRSQCVILSHRHVCLNPLLLTSLLLLTFSWSQAIRSHSSIQRQYSLQRTHLFRFARGSAYIIYVITFTVKTGLFYRE